MKQRIRLTEGDLHRIIRNCVKSTINEKKDRVYAKYSYNSARHEALKKILSDCAHRLYNNNFLFNICDKHDIHYLIANFGDYLQDVGYSTCGGNDLAKVVSQMLKNCGYSKSYKRFVQAMQHLKEASKLFEAASQDVRGTYKEWEPSYPDDNEQKDFSGYSGWGG